MAFIKKQIPVIDKPKEEIKENPSKTLIESFKENGYTEEQLKEVLLKNGLTEREIKIFIEIFLYNVPFAELIPKHKIVLQEVNLLLSKFKILASRNGYSAEKIINKLKF